MNLTNREKKIVAILDDSRYQYVFFSLLLYVVCVYEYQHFVIEKYSYMGFPNNYSLSKALLSILVFFSTSFLVLLKNSSFIKGFTGLLNVLFLMPVLILFQYDTNGGVYVLLSLLLLFIINFNFSIPLFSIVKLRHSQVAIALCLLAVLLFLPFIVSFKINLNSEIFLLGEEVYVIRAAIKNHGNIFTSYLLSPIVQVLLPTVAIFGLIQKRFYFTFIAIGLSVLMYMMIPQKSIFLGIFVVVFFYFFKDPMRKVSVFTFGLFVLVCAGAFLAATRDQLLLESLVLRRYLIIPAYLNHVYYDFFESEPLKYSYSFLKSFYDYPFELGPTYIIGKEAFGNVNTNANNGFLSDAFMNFGKLGMFCFTLMVGLLIKFFDRLSISAKFFGLFFLLLNLLRSSALPTTIITHGLWLLVIIGLVVLRDTKRAFDNVPAEK